MPDLAQGYSADVVLAANESVRVSTTGQATITSAYGAPNGTTTLTANTQTFGPYQVPAKLRITSVTGAANYAQPVQVPVTFNPATNEVNPPALVSGALIPVPTPSGFRWTTHGLNLRRSGNGAVQTDWQITDLIPTPTVIYYVNPLTGSDANSGLTTGLPLANLSTALAKADVDQIQIVGLTGDYLALGVKGWNNTQPTRSVSVINRTGYRFISADASATLPTWTVNGTYANVYQSSAISAANGRSVTDMSSSDYVTYTDESGAMQTLTNQPKRFRTLKRVASLAAVTAEAGTYFHDGTYLQVRPHDDRVLTGTTTMLATSDINNGRMPAVSGATIYAENIDFVGGFRAFLALHADTVTGHKLALNGCSFQGAGSSNGLSVEAACAVYLYRCGAYDNYTDGFNYHAAGNDAATEADAPSVIEVECVAIGNGTTGSSGTSDNASTAHEYTEVISLGCIYVNSDDAPVADINNAQRWMMSCHVGQALTVGSGRQNIKAANSANIWLDDTYAAPGSNERWLAETATTSVIRHSGSGAVVNGSAGSGVVRAYLG